MSNGAPSIPQAAAQAYRDLNLVLATLTNLVMIALAVSVIGEIIQTILLRIGSPRPTRDLLVMFIASIVQAFLLTPYLIAVHRLVILGEVTAAYTLVPGERRFQQFFGWSLALSLGATLPTFLLLLLPVPEEFRIAGAAVISIAVLIVALRVIILFPAVAVDAPGATWDNAMADTKGHAWRIFLIALLASVPLLMAGVILGLMFLDPGKLSIRTVLGALVGGVLGIAVLTLAVVIASRLYEQIGIRVKRGA